MTDPVTLLGAEHCRLRIMSRVLERCCDRLESREEVSVEHLVRILDFLKVYGERLHHAREEELLFPALERSGIPRQGRVEALLIEHEMGRSYLKGMRVSVCRLRAGDGSVVPELVGYAREYAGLQRLHMDGEEGWLFSCAQDRLPWDETARLSCEFAALERRRFGAERLASFDAFVELMEGIYLQPVAGGT